jgi:hypothetical protein
LTLQAPENCFWLFSLLVAVLFSFTRHLRSMHQTKTSDMFMLLKHKAL